MTAERMQALLAAYERIFLERTPAVQVRHVLASQRVNFTDLADWYWREYAELLAPTERRNIAPALVPVIRRLRREFPKERWD